MHIMMTMNIRRLGRTEKAYMIVLLLSFLEIIGMLIYTDGLGFEHGDSSSYLDAFEFNMEGKPDLWRTPIYPLFFGGLCHIFGDVGGRIITTWSHIILFYLSLIPLKKSCEMLWNNKKLTLGIISVYTLWPSMPAIVCSWVSEGIACPLTVLLIYVSLREVKNPSCRGAVLIGTICIFLTFLRPAFVFLLLFYPVGYIIIYLIKKNFRPMIIGVASGIIGGVLIMAYIGQIKQYYDVSVITMVSDVNNFFTLREADVLRPEEIDNPRISAMLAKYREETPEFTGETGYSELGAILNIATPREFHELIQSSISLHRIELAKHMIERIYAVSKSRLNYFDKNNPLCYVCAPLSLNFGIYFLLMIVIACMIITQLVKKGQIPLETIFLWTFSLCMIIVITVGAMNDWARLILPGQGAALLLTGLLFDRIRLKRCLPVLA